VSVTRAMLRAWFEEAPEGSSHMVVAVDEFDWSTYPVYVPEGEDIRRRHRELHEAPMARVMEVYRLDYSFDKQVELHRAVVYELPLDGYDDQVLAAASAISPASLDRGELGPAEVLALCRAEIARRRARDAAKEAAEAALRCESMDRQARVESHTQPQIDGEAARPSPSDANAPGEGPLESSPSARVASPSPSEQSS
jgi:hypothetical protein